VEASAANYSLGDTPSFLLPAASFFFTSEVALRAPLQRENGKKSEEKKEGENEFF
jgi:hypothetical protein